MDQIKSHLFNRFSRYVKINTQSNDESSSIPSSPGQLELGQLLKSELMEMGLTQVEMDHNGYVTALLPSNSSKKVPTLAFLAHLDTAPDASGENVIPQLHQNYQGGDLVISTADHVILRPQECPSLSKCVGHDVVTASGKTLLGADNKAGIAIIMELLIHLMKNPQIKHGNIKVAFTPDEEIGRGVDHFDVKKFAADVAYTIDGDIVGAVEDETFNADSLAVTVHGKSVHPGSAKNAMANAVWIMSDIIASWSENKLPETTEHRDGFIAFMSIQGGVEKASMKGIIREHDLKKMRQMEELFIAIIEEKKIKYPLARIEVEIKEQYRNMKEVIDQHPQVMNLLLRAIQKEGLEAHVKPVRGGTDGARLSFMGLPCPNVFTGGANYHGRYEWVSLDGMNSSLKVLTRLVQEWEQNG